MFFFKKTSICLVFILHVIQIKTFQKLLLAGVSFPFKLSVYVKFYCPLIFAWNIF